MKNSNEKSKWTKIAGTQCDLTTLGVDQKVACGDGKTFYWLIEPQSIPTERDERVNFMQVGRTVECSNCHPEKNYADCQTIYQGMEPLTKCECICHDLPTPNLTPESTDLEEWEKDIENLKCINGAMYFGSAEDPCDCGATKCNNQQTYPQAICELRLFIHNLLSSHSQKLVSEIKEKIVFKIKEKGLHLGYANDIIDIIDNIK